MRFTRYIPSAVIAVVVLGVAACAPPLPPFQGPSPVPVPSVTPIQVCEHWRLPGFRYALVVPQRGAWNNEQLLPNTATWLTGTGAWFEVGQTYTFEVAYGPVRLVWAPDTTPGTAWHVVSPLVYPQATPLTLCPDF